ncbi:4'-phosphopantetheinyl transferase [Longispora fulva]|uniref:4'-phosphopantetheinyl transferase n=1 Tax=Longispora fulva TaxID=619741 RepID=A0A8J7GSC1_9ACTN|nr:4'-phosphopantetheinyl transferase superfamily protein [Longispora fulva]MBG6137353.1 4'-phosphopantetheinyl transferase [Longispora fulva]GIG61293.1 4'-phosphopantetheinyl transferase [Longispora fulva]
MTDVQVWWGRADQASAAHVELFNEIERDRHARFRVASARDQFTVGCAIVRLVLADMTGIAPEKLELDRECTRCAGPHGKPRLVGSDLRFSVSHSGDRIGVAFATGVELGLDVERAEGRDRDGVADAVLTPAELAGWRALPEPQREAAFYTYWTRKESVVKATGDGLNAPMDELHVSAPGEPPRLLTYPGGLALDATMTDLDPGPGYAAALTVLGPLGTLTVHDAGPLLAG